MQTTYAGRRSTRAFYFTIRHVKISHYSVCLHTCTQYNIPGRVLSIDLYLLSCAIFQWFSNFFTFTYHYLNSLKIFTYCYRNLFFFPYPNLIWYHRLRNVVLYHPMTLSGLFYNSSPRICYVVIEFL